ncbi:hypothetical protein ARMSODRAFT_976396 [Armillaria solidipes]|uniref:Uncharacterized protein n=1 Tax=Armillaria solidipes TaxID=1076256 RepID=A0A2H3BB85_9AGAR|nr:hypothetical protein ARMSODRAFT_976396 [Armillaria solidipes]
MFSIHIFPQGAAWGWLFYLFPQLSHGESDDNEESEVFHSPGMILIYYRMPMEISKHMLVILGSLKVPKFTSNKFHDAKMHTLVDIEETPEVLPDFSSIHVLTTQLSDSWFNEVIIECLTYGMYTALLAIVLWRILSSSTAHGRQTKVLAEISIFMYIMATMHLAVRWFYARRAFIANGIRTVSIYGYDRQIYGLTCTITIWAETIDDQIRSRYTNKAKIPILSEPVQDPYFFWIPKLHTVQLRYGVDPYSLIAGGPLYGRAGSSGGGIGGSLSFPLYAHYVEQGKPVTPWESNMINWGVAYYSMTLSTTIICTTLIVYRLA